MIPLFRIEIFLQRLISLFRSLYASLWLSRGVLTARRRGESPEHQADNIIEQTVGELLMRRGNTKASRSSSFLGSSQRREHDVVRHFWSGGGEVAALASSGLGVVVGKVEDCWVSELVSWSIESSAESMDSAVFDGDEGAGAAPGEVWL
ncbi:hypothetical protein TorRG33x02_184890 [Trema orientale]|uniref:Uncharacterized protein n=1 Tax=Trema orientale TaxID=63057 RepID=A0A2P5EJQ1_TREOI|nr:hypothetical protein TorRG33x02_184890 [Trema orientale]